MSDVTCACCAPLVAEVRARGLAPESLVEGLGIALADLEDPRKRIPWDPFTVFARRAAELLGGPEQIEEIAARSTAQAVPALVKRLLPRLGSARPVYLLGARWWGPWVFRGTRATCEELADGRLREVVEILPGYAECPLFFEGLRGVLRVMPQLFGQPEAVVELHHDGRRGEFLITPPPAKRRLWHLFRRRASVAALPGDLEELGFHQEQLREGLQRIRRVGLLLDEKSRRLDTLRRLGRELSRWHAEGELAGAVIRLLEEQFPVRGIRLCARQRHGEGFVELAASGDRSGAPSGTHALEAAGRTVGRLELWVREVEGPGPEDDAALRELLPWIGVALDNVRSELAIRGVAQWLEGELADWNTLERRLERVVAGRAQPVYPPAHEPEELSETILLVENDAVLRGAVRRLLELEGYSVVEAGNRSDALAICASRSTPIHLLVTDVVTPSIGREVAGPVMRLHPELRGVLMLRLRPS